MNERETSMTDTLDPIARSRMTTRQHADVNALGIPSMTLVGVRAVIAQALFCRQQSRLSRQSFDAISWHGRREAYLRAAKILCDCYR